MPHGAGVGLHLIFPGALPGADDDLAAAVFLEVPRVVQVGQVIQGGIEIDILVHIIADEHG